MEPMDEPVPGAGSEVPALHMAASGQEDWGVSEPVEDEEESTGWEIVAAPSSGRRESPGFAVCAVSGASEMPYDLIMGCLDPDCAAEFREGREGCRCGCCGLLFCEQHLAQWPLYGWSGAAGKGCGDSCPSPRGPTLAESLGVTIGPSSISLCRECRSTMAAGSLTLGPGATAAARRPSVLGSDSVQIAAEARALASMPLAGLRAEDEAEDTSRTVARRLLLRKLEGLRVCLRPWAEFEREWVWRLQEDLTTQPGGWVAQFARQACWDSRDAGGKAKDAECVFSLVEGAQASGTLLPRDALQVIGVFQRRAAAAVAALGERRVGQMVTHLAKALRALEELELVCSLELLLDSGDALGSAGATGGRRQIVDTLLTRARGATPAAETLRGELFWALESRGHERPWAVLAAQELMRPGALGEGPDLPAEAEVGLLRQLAWVRLLEGGQIDAARVEPAWGSERAFPVAVWPPNRKCIGLDRLPTEATSKCAPSILRCRLQPDHATAAPSVPGRGSVGPGRTSGLMLKRDPAGMRREQQVGQTLRLLEHLIWKDPGLRGLLQSEGLRPEDVRVTFAIAMTGPGTAMLEFVEDAQTLRDVRAHYGSPLGTGEASLSAYLAKHNPNQTLMKLALTRLAFTASVSAVLSFVAGLGDRHHENFMVTKDGRLLNVDYGYALGQEPLDSVLIHYAFQWGRPIVTLQYQEVHEALGKDLIDRIFWPVVRSAYLCVRQHAGLLAEMVYCTMVRDLRRDLHGDPAMVERCWATAQAYVSRHCVPSMGEPAASRFVHALLEHCGKNERGVQVRDQLRRLKLRQRTQMCLNKATEAARSLPSAVTSATGAAVGDAGQTFWRHSEVASSAVRSTATGLLGSVRGLLREANLSSPKAPGPTGHAD